MLTIRGNTFAEVFANLADHELLSGRERLAALKVHQWMREWERFAVEGARAAESGDREAWEESAREQDRLMSSRPFTGSHVAGPGPEWRSFIVGDIKFTVCPYTTDATMNVGIDLVRTES